MQLLIVLTERLGEILTREELQQRLWSSESEAPKPRDWTHDPGRFPLDWITGFRNDAQSQRGCAPKLPLATSA